ncbi:MAG: LruC domain-containing protein [Bacteroidota bacterium]
MSFFSTVHRLRAWSLTLLGAGAVFVGCDTVDSNAPIDPAAGDPDVMTVAPDFDYATTRTIRADVRALTNSDAPLEGVRFDVYDGDKLLGSALTDAQGRLVGDFVASATATELTLRTEYLGLPSEQTVALDGDRAVAQFGGDTEVAPSLDFASAASSAFTYISDYDNSGKPIDLIAPRDVMSQDFLRDLNAALPEKKSVLTRNPEFVAEGNQLDVHLTAEADVWVTFVHEGAGYKNAFGYYVYDPANPPASVADLTEHLVVFPNASYNRKGGKLLSGDKMYLGRFDAGMAIGWFIVQDGWDSNARAVSETRQRYYSNPAFNPAGEQHNVFLNFTDYGRYVLGFDDQPLTWGDQDFNDVVFYVTANPVSAIDPTDVVRYGSAPPDADGDGVPDTQDDAPNDPTVATYEYGPARDQFGTLAYEDLWPGQGDYDFNDLVVDYNLRFARNAAGDLTKLDGQFVVKAIGAGYRNALALALPVDAAAVASVSGQRLGSGLFTTAGNGAESGRTAAIVPVFDDANAILARPGGYFANTQMAAPYVSPEDTVAIALVFASPVAAPALSVTWLNPFLVSNQERGREVHLPNQMPSEGADVALLGSSQDRTNEGLGFTYKNERGLPWALHFADGFVYPTEQTPVTEAYTRFRAWAESSGAAHADWYTDERYRVDEKVYGR